MVKLMPNLTTLKIDHNKFNCSNDQPDILDEFIDKINSFKHPKLEKLNIHYYGITPA